MFGFDKLYVGAKGLFIAQLVCALLIVGLLFSAPYQFISVLTLTLCVLFGTNTFLYPNVDWAPTTKNDKIIAWIIVGLYVLAIVVGTSMSIHVNVSSEGFDDEKKKKKRLR